MCTRNFDPEKDWSPRDIGRMKWILRYKIGKPIHAHCAWFGSELACSECNPICWQNHQMGNPNHLQWCGEEKCPMNPNRPISPELKAEMDAWERIGIESWAKTEKMLEEMSKKKTVEQLKENVDEDTINAQKSGAILIDSENEFCSEEDYEDRLRRSHRKSIRNQGYHGHQRGKEKRREP